FEPPAREVGRETAKERLGISPDRVVLLTVGAAFKFAYRQPAQDDLSFLELVRPVLDEHPEAVLLAVGPLAEGDWAEAERETGGRVIAYGPVEDPAVQRCAADVFVQSFPVMSPTALLECGALGVPAVAYARHPDELTMIQMHDYGLPEALLRLETPEAFREQ